MMQISKKEEKLKEGVKKLQKSLAEKKDGLLKATQAQEIMKGSLAESTAKIKELETTVKSLNMQLEDQSAHVGCLTDDLLLRKSEIEKLNVRMHDLEGESNSL